MPVALRILAGLIALNSCAALVLQFGLIATGAAQLGYPGPVAAIIFAAFFTTQANLLIAVFTAAVALGARWFIGDGRMGTALGVWFVAAGTVFGLMLRPYWDHHGAQLAADILLHYVGPALYVVFWLVALPKSRLHWRDVLIWQIYPAAYLAVVLILAQRSRFYPYPIIDLPALGVVRVGLNIATLCAIYLGVAAAALAVARALRARKQR